MLIEATDAHFAALIAGESPDGLPVAEGGIETPEVLAMLRGLSAEVGESFEPNAWLIVEDGEVAGLTSLVRTPYVGDTVMIGYGVAASRRRRGIATRAVAEVLAWARADFRVSTVTAETASRMTSPTASIAPAADDMVLPPSAPTPASSPGPRGKTPTSRSHRGTGGVSAIHSHPTQQIPSRVTGEGETRYSTAVSPIDAMRDDEINRMTGFPVKTMITVPIGYDKQVYGAIQCLNKNPASGEEFFSQKDIRLVEEVADYSARIIYMARNPGFKWGEEDVARYVARVAKLEYIDLREVEIECLPTDVPEGLTADISALEIGDMLRVRDVVAPEGVTILTDGDAPVISIVTPAALRTEVDLTVPGEEGAEAVAPVEAEAEAASAEAGEAPPSEGEGGASAEGES